MTMLSFIPSLIRSYLKEALSSISSYQTVWGMGRDGMADISTASFVLSFKESTVFSATPSDKAEPPITEPRFSVSVTTAGFDEFSVPVAMPVFTEFSTSFILLFHELPVPGTASTSVSFFDTVSALASVYSALSEDLIFSENFAFSVSFLISSSDTAPVPAAFTYLNSSLSSSAPMVNSLSLSASSANLTSYPAALFVKPSNPEKASAEEK